MIKKSDNMPSWWDVWEQRGQEFPSEDAAYVDGFDHGLGKMDSQMIEFLVNKIRSSLTLTRRDLLLEAGCGSGMLLKPLSHYVRRIVGVDYAPCMARRCKAKLPRTEIVVADIKNLPFRDNTFDKVVSFSVFQYLSSPKYAKRVVQEYFRICKLHGRIFVGDIPDENRKTEYLKSRFNTIRDHLVSYDGVFSCYFQ